MGVLCLHNWLILLFTTIPCLFTNICLTMAARIKPPNRNNRQPVDLSNQDAVREFFRKQWHRPKRKETKTVKTIKINGKLVKVKARPRLSDDENSKKLCRKGFTDDWLAVSGHTIFWPMKTDNPLLRGELLNEELRRMKIAEKEKGDGNDNDVEVGEMVRPRIWTTEK